HVTVVQTCSLPIFYAFADNRMPRCAEVYCQWPAGCREIPARHCPRKNHPIGPRRTGFLASTDASAYTEVSRDCFSLFRFVERERDRKSTRLNSSHVAISYAVFCLKKKKIK